MVDAVVRDWRRKRGREERSERPGQLSVTADQSAYVRRPARSVGHETLHRSQIAEMAPGSFL